MLRILFTAEDVATTRFVPEPTPVLETKLALVGLQRGIAAPWGERWRHRARSVFPRSADPVRQLVPGFASSVSPSTVVGDFDEWAELGPTYGPAMRRAEVRLWFGHCGPGVPPVIRNSALFCDPEADRAFMRSIRAAFGSVVQPYWPDIRANHRAELLRHGHVMASRGVGAALTSMIGGARWAGDWLLIDSPQDRVVRLGGRGLMILPATFWTGAPLIGVLPGRPALLAYPAPTTLPVRVGPESDTLAAVLGTTRAAVLRLLLTDHTTGEIARELGISAATASEHATVLRASRLITSRRDGKTVVHGADILGRELIETNRP